MRKRYKEFVGRAVAFIVICVILLFCYFLWFVSPYISFLWQKGIITTLLYPTTKIIANENSHIKIVLLGVAGGMNEGPLLTDSMQLIDINLKTKRVGVISIPRDIWSSAMKDKINSAYAYGVVKHNNALFWLKPELKKITGIAPDYYFVIDFDKFKKLVDRMGGIDVYVDRSFIDTEFPVEGREDDACGGDITLSCRYQTIQFNKGRNHFDGETALKFARSRHAEGVEGSDFAREQRQQKVLHAALKKILSPSFILSRKKFLDFITFTDNLFSKNISLQQIAALTRTYFLNQEIMEINLIHLNEELFTVPSVTDYEGKYVLIPKNGFSQLRNYIQKKISD